MIISLVKFQDKFFVDKKPYWKIHEGHGQRGKLLASNLDDDNLESSWEKLSNTLSFFDGGKLMITTLSSPAANNGFAHKLVYGNYKEPAKVAGFGGVGMGGSQVFEFMMQQMQAANSQVLAQMQANTSLQLEAIRNEFELKQQINDLESELNSEEESIGRVIGISLADAIKPLATGIAASMSKTPLRQPATMGTLGVKKKKEVKETTEKKEETPQPQPQQQQGFSFDKMAQDVQRINKHFPDVHPNVLLDALANYLDINPDMAAMLQSQILPKDAE